MRGRADCAVLGPGWEPHPCGLEVTSCGPGGGGTGVTWCFPRELLTTFLIVPSFVCKQPSGSLKVM